jgi:hypothetical protein
MPEPWSPARIVLLALSVGPGVLCAVVLSVVLVAEAVAGRRRR